MDSKMGIDRQRAIILSLVVLIVLAFGYILIDKYQEGVLREQLMLFQQGAQYGYGQAILQVIQQASTCQAVPLFAGNVTINVVALECMQQVPAGNQTQ